MSRTMGLVAVSGGLAGLLAWILCTIMPRDSRLLPPAERGSSVRREEDPVPYLIEMRRQLAAIEARLEKMERLGGHAALPSARADELQAAPPAARSGEKDTTSDDDGAKNFEADRERLLGSVEADRTAMLERRRRRGEPFPEGDDQCRWLEERIREIRQLRSRQELAVWLRDYSDYANR